MVSGHSRKTGAGNGAYDAARQAEPDAIMYTDYFKLSEPPFSLTPDPRFLFMSERHREGLAHLFYGVQQPGGFVQLTGDVGSGKTTLCRCLVKQLPPATDIAMILNPRLTVVELLATVCDELGVPYPAETASVKVLVDALNQRLLESHAGGRRTVLLIDEAQNLSEDVLEQIRLLTNLETSKEKLLQIILIGQPELLSILMRRRLRQLAQRITARYHLLPLSRRDTCDYIRHRLLVAGRNEPLFTRRAMHSVYRRSRGVPRAINIICDRALLGAYAMDKRRIGAGIVRRASRETRGAVPWTRRLRPSWVAAAAALAALMLLAAILFAPDSLSFFREKAAALMGRDAPPPATKAARVAAPSATATPGSIPAGAVPGSSLAGPPEAAPSGGAARAPASAESGASPELPPSLRELVRVLEGTPSAGKGEYGFANLYVEMGLKLPPNPSDLGCGDVRARGYACLPEKGTWNKLRRYDLPALLEIAMPDGSKRRVALVRLAGERATLAVGKWEQSFAPSEISRVWDGSFILVWKPPFPLRQLSLGDSGSSVAWVRRSLDALDGRDAPAGEPELFDEDLRERVLEFQRTQSLIRDGLVGSETLVRLTLALQGEKAPSLSRRTRT